MLNQFVNRTSGRGPQALCPAHTSSPAIILAVANQQPGPSIQGYCPSRVVGCGAYHAHCPRTPAWGPVAHSEHCARASTRRRHSHASRKTRAAAEGVLMGAAQADQQRLQQQISRLRQIKSYRQLGLWLQQDAAEGQGDTDYLDPRLSTAALGKMVQELEPNYWSQLDDKSYEECQALSAYREDAFVLVLDNLVQALPSLPVPLVAYCADSVASLQDANDEDFFKVVCQHITRTSNQLAAAAEAGRAAATSPSQPAVLACELDELEMVLSKLCSALSAASYYSPTTMQLIAKEVTASIASCSPRLAAQALVTFMHLQHYDRPMLNAVGVYLLRPSSDSASRQGQATASPGSLNIALLQPFEAAQVAAAFAFFNVQNTAFYQVLLARMSAAKLPDLSLSDLTTIYITCQLMPAGMALPPALTDLLGAAVDEYGAAARLEADQKRSFVCDGGPTCELERVQEMFHYEAYELLCLRQLRTLMQQTQGAGAAASGAPAPQMYVPASPHAPWVHVPMSVPGQSMDGVGRQVALSVLSAGEYCKNNPNRMLGTTQARMRCLQRLGWPVWPLGVQQWHEQVVDAAEVAGVAEDYETASLVWAQAVTAGPNGDPAVAARVGRMVADLSMWVQTGVAGAITLHDTPPGTATR